MSILDRIFGRLRKESAAAPAPAAPPTQAQPAPAPVAAAPAPADPIPAPAPAAPAPTYAPIERVDMHQVLADMAAKNPQKLKWQTSIVDLMKLVGMESTLAERKELADEMGYTGDKSDTAKMNIWLHEKLMERLKA